MLKSYLRITHIFLLSQYKWMDKETPPHRQIRLATTHIIHTCIFSPYFSCIMLCECTEVPHREEIPTITNRSEERRIIDQRRTKTNSNPVFSLHVLNQGWLQKFLKGMFLFDREMYPEFQKTRKSSCFRFFNLCNELQCLEG